MSDQDDHDRPIFSDGLITPFIDAAQQQDQDCLAEIWNQFELAVWGKIGNTVEASQAKRIERFLSRVLESRAEVTRLTQENKDQHDEIQQLHLAWLEQDRQQRTALAQEHERLKAAAKALAQSWRDDYERCGRDYEMVCMPQCANELDALLADPSAEERKPRP